jgi:hypothetical protein
MQSRVQKIAGDMFLSSLLKLRDASLGEIPLEALEVAATAVPVPQNDEFGECLPWVLRVVQKLHEMGLLELVDSYQLGQEFTSFAAGNKAFATRTKIPNVKVSKFSS